LHYIIELMTRRVSNKYRILKFYQEDLWGKLALRLKFKKIKLNRLFHEIFQEKNVFRTDVARERERLKAKYKINDSNISNIERKRRNFVFHERLREFVKSLRQIHFRIPFNFRIDKGKPKRKYRRLSRFARRLKNRHKFRKFATQSMNVRQLRSYLKKARKKHSVFVQFFRLFETRVDTLAFRLNFVESAGEGRQLVNHRNFLINGRIVSFPSEYIDMFDIFSVKDKQFFYDKSLSLFVEKLVIFSLPSYLEVNFRIMAAIVYTWPTASKVFYLRNLDARLMGAIGSKMRNT
jgi:small subunit ribosomal protein S4